MTDNKCSFDLDVLTTMYKDNPHVLGKLQTYLDNLPMVLETEAKKHDDRVSKYHERVSEQDQFYQTFLNKHQYYYMRNNNAFYEYDGNTYRVVKEDDIHYHLLSTITDERRLVQWKHKTKQSLVKKIRERDLFTSIPNTTTIQTVLGSIQCIFETKQESKYFLTALGDCVLKKNGDASLVFFVTPMLKKFIAMIDSIVSPIIGFSVAHNFISKYHETHKILTYRLIKSNDVVHFQSIKNILNDICIDLLCVSVHYSTRYNGSDDYLRTHTDTSIQNHALFFTTHCVQTVADNFITQCIDLTTGVPSTASPIAKVSWKHMHYLWKSYLHEIRVPNMVYSHNLQLMLATKLNSETIDGDLFFIGITSKYLPHVSSFLAFWEKYITVHVHNNSIHEYEIDEFVALYKKSEMKGGLISEDSMVKLIYHYFSHDVQISDSKYVANISCSLWTKTDDIDKFLAEYKHIEPDVGAEDVENPSLIAIDDLYRNYTKWASKNRIQFVVSKQYFFKYVLTQLSKYIEFDAFIQTSVFE